MQCHRHISLVLLSLLAAGQAASEVKPLTKEMCPPGTKLKVRTSKPPKSRAKLLKLLIQPSGTKGGKSVKTSSCERPGGIKHGPWRSCDGSNGICEQGSYRDGKLHGVWTSFDGRRKVEERSYRAGVLHGRMRLYLSGGQYHEQDCKNGKVDPIRKVYSGNGKLLGTYRWDGRTGVLKEWYANGRQSSEYPHRAGKKHGRCIEWFADGAKKFDCLYADGIRHGRCSSWWSKDKPWKKEFYRAGLLDGPYASWTLEGKLEERGSCKNGRRRGRWTRADKDGKTYLYIYGKEGKLISTTRPKYKTR